MLNLTGWVQVWKSQGQNRSPTASYTCIVSIQLFLSSILTFLFFGETEHTTLEGNAVLKRALLNRTIPKWERRTVQFNNSGRADSFHSFLTATTSVILWYTHEWSLVLVLALNFLVNCDVPFSSYAWPNVVLRVSQLFVWSCWSQWTWMNPRSTRCYSTCMWCRLLLRFSFLWSAYLVWEFDNLPDMKHQFKAQHQTWWVFAFCFHDLHGKRLIDVNFFYKENWRWHFTFSHLCQFVWTEALANKCLKLTASNTCGNLKDILRKKEESFKRLRVFVRKASLFFDIT